MSSRLTNQKSSFPPHPLILSFLFSLLISLSYSYKFWFCFFLSFFLMKERNEWAKSRPKPDKRSFVKSQRLAGQIALEVRGKPVWFRESTGRSSAQANPLLCRENNVGGVKITATREAVLTSVLSSQQVQRPRWWPSNVLETRAAVMDTGDRISLDALWNCQSFLCRYQPASHAALSLKWKRKSRCHPAISSGLTHITELHVNWVQHTSHSNMWSGYDTCHRVTHELIFQKGIWSIRIRSPSFLGGLGGNAHSSDKGLLLEARITLMPPPPRVLWMTGKQCYFYFLL